MFYEGMFLVDNDLAVKSPEGAAKLVADVIEKYGGRILHQERWDERKLTYEIRGKKRATYLIAYFEAAGDAVKNIYRQVEIHDELLRALILERSDRREALLAAAKEGRIPGPKFSVAPETEGLGTERRDGPRWDRDRDRDRDRGDRGFRGGDRRPFNPAPPPDQP
ncbi:MAG: 30S ribosomal protein S6 [Planctomycetes bacterium]|nr:30S ribosomal protein S6 [Planctomycetota bacterium]